MHDQVVLLPEENEIALPDPAVDRSGENGIASPQQRLHARIPGCHRDDYLPPFGQRETQRLVAEQSDRRKVHCGDGRPPRKNPTSSGMSGGAIPSIPEEAEH